MTSKSDDPSKDPAAKYVTSWEQELAYFLCACTRLVDKISKAVDAETAQRKARPVKHYTVR